MLEKYYLPLVTHALCISCTKPGRTGKRSSGFFLGGGVVGFFCTAPRNDLFSVTLEHGSEHCKDKKN